MSVTVKPSAVTGSVTAPSSKSATHRMLVLSALADGESLIRRPLSSEDTEATLRVLAGLGVEARLGEVWRIRGGELTVMSSSVSCGDSGTTMRFMASLAALAEGDLMLTGGKSLSSRPMEPLLSALRLLGVRSSSNNGCPPVTIHGEGRIRGGETRLPGDISSQFVSSLLAAAPRAESPVSIKLTTQLESRPYVEMTLDAMKTFGADVEHDPQLQSYRVQPQRYTPRSVTVEGDWSSAAYLLAAGVLAGNVTVSGLDAASRQADKAILDILSKMNAEVTQGEVIRAERSRLQGVDYDLRDCPDLFPILAALCAAAEGESTLTGLARLRLKESDRTAAMLEGLHRMGVEAEQSGDTVRIIGGKPRGATIDPYSDHRIAMSFNILALTAEGETTIRDPGCVAKSYPGFWKDLESIGGTFTE